MSASKIRVFWGGEWIVPHDFIKAKPDQVKALVTMRSGQNGWVFFTNRKRSTQWIDLTSSPKKDEI